MFRETGYVSAMIPSQFKVAIVGIESPEAGGAFSAEKLMLEQIQQVLNGNEILIVYSRKNRFRLSEAMLRLGRFLRNLFLIGKFKSPMWAILHRFTWIPVSRFERKLINNKVDLVFFVGSFDRAIELKRIPFIATVWDLGHRDLPSLPELGSNREFEFREWRIRNIAIKAYAIVVDSEVTKQKLESFYGIEGRRIHSLPFCPEEPAALPEIQKQSFAFYPAHYWSHKNHIVLLEAIALLILKGKQPRKLKLTGLDRGNYKYLEEKVSKLGISEYVEFLGFVSKVELDFLYRQASIMVMPSLLGPTNLPPLEALLRGCPVAVSESARANLGNWKGIISLVGSDVAAWADVLDSSRHFEKVAVLEIQNFVFRSRELNVEKLAILFQDFKHLRGLYS